MASMLASARHFEQSWPVVQRRDSNPIVPMMFARFHLLPRITALCLNVALVLILSADPSHAFIEQLITRFASDETGGVKVEGLSGTLTGKPAIEKVTISDAAGPWLRLTGVKADIQPLNLLRGRIALDSLDIAQIDILRKPVQAAGKKSDGFLSGIPQVALRVDAFSVDRLVLAEQVVGEAAEVRLSGSAVLNDDPVQQTLGLVAERLDGPAGTLAAKLDLRPGENRFDLDVQFSEPEGGTLVRLLKVPDLPSMQAAISGSGPLDAWTGDLSIALAGAPTVSGTATIGRHDAGLHVLAELAGRVALLIPAELRPVFAGDTMVSLDLTRADAGLVRVAKANLRSATTQISGLGQFDPSTKRINGETEIAFASKHMQVAFTLANGEAVAVGESSLKATLAGTLNAADWALQGQVAAFRGLGYSGESLDISATGKNGNFSRRIIPFQATATAGQLAIPDMRAVPYLAGQLRLAASGTWTDGLLTLDGAETASAVATVKAQGTIDAGAGSLDLDVQASADTAVDPRLPPLLGDGRVLLAGKVGRSPQGRLSVSRASIVAAALSATGNLTLDGNALTADAVLTAPDLSHFQSELSGSANITVRADGPLTAPNVVIAAQGETIRLRGKDLVDPKLAFEGVLSTTTPSGKLAGSAKFAGKPVEASVQIASTAQGERLAEDIRISAGGAVVEGKLSAPAGGNPAGRFEFSIPDLAEIAPLLLRDDLSGAMQGTIILGEREGRPALDLAATAPRAKLAGLSLTDSRLDAVIIDPLAAPLIAGRFESSRLEASGAIVEALIVKAEHAGAATAFNATATTNGTPVSATGTLARRDGATVIALEKGNAIYRGIDASLKAPARLTIADGAVRIERAALAVAGGGAIVSGLIGKSLDLEIELAAVPASIADTFAPGLGLAGAISGTVSLSGPTSSPRVPFKITWREASAQASRSVGLPALSMAAEGTYADKAVDIQSGLSGSGLDLAVNGRVRVAGPVDMDLAMRGTVPLEIAATRLAGSGMRLDGSAGVDIALKGTLDAPDISGAISTAGATFIDTRSAIVVKNIASRIALSGFQARIESLTGTLGAKGALAVNGTIGVRPQDGFPADLSIQLNNANYADGRILSAAFNAALTLNGSLVGEPLLGGRIDIARADIQVPDRLPGGSVSSIAVAHINAPADVRRQAETLKPQQAGGASSSNLGLNLTVSAPRQVNVRGRGLDAELGGQVQLQGLAAAPRAIGAFNLIRGRLNILTRRLAMSRGTVTFTGSLIPLLDFSADTSSGTITAAVAVRGPATNPKFEFTSVPALPQDEVLAILLFDRSLSKLSPLQIAQLASAISTLTGAGGGPGVLDRLRSSLGVDDLDITTDETGAASVGVGKYLGENIYLGVKQGATSGSSRVTIDLDITKSLKARGEVGADGKSKAGIYFEKEY